MKKHLVFTLIISALLLLSRQTYAQCDLVLANPEAHETPFRTYGNSGISLALQWIVLLDAEFHARDLPPANLLSNPFFKKYLNDRGVVLEKMDFDAKERWFGKYLLWVLDRMNRPFPDPRITQLSWLKRLSGEEWDLEKVKALSLKNKKNWQKVLADKFPLKDPAAVWSEEKLIYLIPTLTQSLSHYNEEFKAPVASRQEHHRYGLARVPSPFWGQLNSAHSALVGVQLNPLFAETKELQTKRHLRSSETEVERNWAYQFGLVFPFDANGNKTDLEKVVESKQIRLRKLVYELMLPQDFEELCNEYFWRLKHRGELQEHTSPEQQMAQLREFYQLMGATQFSLWIGPVIPSKKILAPKYHKDFFKTVLIQ